MADSTDSSKSKRPRKSDFPLQIHKGRGYWCKIVKRKRIYFEKVSADPSGTKSLNTWLEQRDDLLAGRKPASQDSKRIKDLCNHWLSHKQNKLQANELSQRSFDEYKSTTDFVVAQLGSNRAIDNVDADDFATMRVALSKQYGVNGLAKRIQQVRSLFKHGWEAGLLDRPAKFGPGFEKPSAKVMRQHRIAKGKQDFDAAELREMLRHARPNIRAMILLGLQAGLGNTDIAELPLSAVNLKTGWVDYPRAKTATHRRFPLWPETIEAINAALAVRPEVESEYLFISARGKDYTDAKRNGYRVAGDFVQVTDAANITGKRGFYCLRRTFQTQAEEARDLAAVQSVMGHIATERDMSARYRQSISDERLTAVVEVVRQWLLPIPKAGEVAQ